MADDLQGKTALVTGSAQGLGAIIGEVLAREKVHILVNCCHHPEKAEEICARIRKNGGSAEVFVCDVTSEKELAEKVTPRTIDILVNNARRDPYKRPEGVSDGAWFNTLMNVNVTGTYLCTMAVKEGMKARRWGRILNVSSVQAYLGMAGLLTPYAVSKAAMLSLTRCFAAELGDWNITVNSLAPGMVITENIRTRLTEEQIAEKLKKYPLHRAATSEEVAEMAVQVIRCGAMTGEVLNINSGLYMPA